RTVVPSGGPDARIEPPDRLHVVVQDVRPGREHAPQRVAVSQEVGNQNLHPRGRDLGPNGADRGGELEGPAVGKLVPVDRGHDDVMEPEPARGFGHAAGLFGIDRERLPAPDVAEGTGTRADVSQNEKGRGVTRETIADIRAVRALAHGVEIERAENRLVLEVLLAGRNLRLEPFRPSRGRRLGAQPLIGAERLSLLARLASSIGGEPERNRRAPRRGGRGGSGRRREPLRSGSIVHRSRTWPPSSLPPASGAR